MKQFSTIAFLLLSASGALSAQTTWKSDKAHSQVQFTVTHMLISEVTGRFTDFDAMLDQPRGAAADDFTGSKVEATIRTASVNTDNEFRDKHLRSDDFFNADSFPAISFKGTRFARTGANTYEVAGDLTIRNITKPVVLNATLKGQMTDPKGHTKLGFKGTTTIDRFEFGTKWKGAIDGGLIVSKEVAITLLMEFNKQEAEAKK